MYRELQQLCNQHRQNYNFETPTLSSSIHDIENYVIIYEQCESNIVPTCALDLKLIRTLGF